MVKDIDIDENVDLLDITNNNEQSGFLQSTLGQVINFSVDTGLRAILPDIIENEIIDIKNTIINEGFTSGINEAIDSAIDFGKSALGVMTGNFESIAQAEKAIEKGGIIDGISNVLNYTIDKVTEMGVLPEQISNLIRNGKDAVLNNITSNIKQEFKSQSENVENLQSYTELWREGFENQDLNQMEEYIDKIQSKLKEIMPIENLISEARQIENIHELIKNNGGDFNLSEEELELANILS